MLDTTEVMAIFVIFWPILAKIWLQRLCQSQLKKNSNFENFKTPYLPQMGTDSPE